MRRYTYRTRMWYYFSPTCRWFMNNNNYYTINGFTDRHCAAACFNIIIRTRVTCNCRKPQCGRNWFWDYVRRINYYRALRTHHRKPAYTTTRVSNTIAEAWGPYSASIIGYWSWVATIKPSNYRLNWNVYSLSFLFRYLICTRFIFT